jgi:hypothetical protein
MNIKNGIFEKEPQAITGTELIFILSTQPVNHEISVDPAHLNSK